MLSVSFRLEGAFTAKEVYTSAYIAAKAVHMQNSMEQVGYVFTRRRNTMKARIPMISESKKEKLRSEIKVEVDKAWKQVEQEKEYDITRRVLKTIIYVLNTEYGYGIKRISRLFNSFTQMLENSKKRRGLLGTC